ncbi:MAG: MFS transporter, partial [Nakamurella sp.]
MSDGPARRVSAPRISRAISFGLGSGTMLQPLNSSMIAVAIIGIANHFGTMQGTSWVISGLYVATAVAAPMAGSLGSIFGPRRVYLSGLVLIMAGAVLGGLAPSLGWLIVARVLLGLGTASQYPAAITIVRYVADRERAQVSSGIAVLSICAQSMVAVGPTL